MAVLLGAAAIASCGETRGTLVTTPVTTDADAGTWRPTTSTSWQVQLSGSLDASMDVALYEIDSFATTASQLATLPGGPARGLLHQRWNLRAVAR